MINGQLNMNMLEVVALPVSSRLLATAAATADGALQVGSDFAGLLHDIQLMAKEKVTLASETGETALVDVITKHLLDVESVAVSPAFDLPGRLQAAPPPMSASETTVAKREDNVDVQAEVAPLGIDQSGVISQMALTMYSQPGRMPEVNTPTKLTVDAPQNVATEQPAAIAVPTVEMHKEQTLSVSTQAAALKPAMIEEPITSTGAEQNQQLATPSPTTAEKQTKATTVALVAAQPATSDRTSNADKPQALPADRLQKVAAATEQPALATVPLAGINREQAIVKEPVAATGAEQAQHKQLETGRTTAADKQTTTTLTTAARTESTTVRQVLSDRTSEVNKPPALPVDRQQNVANTTEKPAFISVPAAMSNPEQAVVSTVQTATDKTAIDLTQKPLASTGAEQQRHWQTEMVRITAVGNQPAAVVSTVTAVTVGTGPTAIQPADPGRMTEVSKLPVHSTDRLQKAAPTAVQPGASETGTVVEKAEPAFEDSVRVLAPVQKAVFEKQATTFDTNQRQQTEPVHISDVERQPVADKATSTTAITMSDESVAAQGLKTTVVPATAPTEKQVAASLPLQTERLSLQNSTSYSPAVSPESELDIQMSQARPITAIVTAATAFANIHSDVPGHQQLPSEQQIEKIRTGNEKSIVKEMTAAMQSTTPTNESMGSYKSSGDGEMNQGRSDTTSDNLMLAQNMRGQLSTENQKVAAANTKPAFSEPVRQEIPDQVMQQVKERLVQHDVKPGGQQIKLTLSPEHLGELKMNLNLQGQKLSVEIVTENRAVRDAIILHTDALKESLARQNITMESFDVTTGGKGSGGQGQNHNAWRELAKQQQQQHLWTSPRGYNTAQADLPSSQTLHRQQGLSMLDIHY